MSFPIHTQEGYKLALVTATGPSANVSVGAGASANVDLSISFDTRIIEALGIAGVSGLPSGVVIQGIEFPSTSTVRLVVFNPTAAAITVTANSVSARVLVRSV